ncbi:hypothetical protein LINPERPRIM_LOCUS2656 [Linum perenne]
MLTYEYLLVDLILSQHFPLPLSLSSLWSLFQFTIRFHFALSCRPLTFSLSTHRYGSAAGKGRSSGFGSSKMDLPSATMRTPTSSGTRRPIMIALTAMTRT